MKKWLLSIFMILAAVLYAKEVNVKILGTSDVHGRIVPWSYAADEEDKSGSYAQISTYVKEVRESNKNVILVEVGDSIQDNSIDVFATEKNHPVPKVLNYMKYDVFVLGNHEFNFGMPALDGILKDMKAKKLTANFYHNNGKRYIAPTTVIEKEGVKIGIIGITTPMAAKFEEDTGYLKDYKFTSPIEETKKQVAELKKKGVDAIVVVAHMGIDNENNISDTGVRDLVNAVEGIDVIVAGHMHVNVKKELINGVLITEPHRHGTMVSEVNLKFDVEGKNVKLMEKEATTVSVADKEADSEVVKIYQPYHDRLRKIANETIGETENDMVPQGKNHGISIAFSKDTGMSSFITDVQKYYSKADVVAFSYNYENVRLDKGPIRRKDIVFNYRYAGGDVSVYEMTGKQLKDYMEWSADYFDTIEKGDKDYRYNDVRGKSKYVTFDIFGGEKYKIDLRNAKGNKIVGLELADGTKITSDMKLKVGMNSYRFDQLIKKGGIFDGQNIPLVWSSKEVMGQEKGTIQNMMIDYIKKKKNGKIEGISHNRWEIIGL